jgi:hypothetical protein
LAPDAPLRIHPKEEKRVTVKIPNKAEARELKEQSKEHIVGRIQQAAGGKTAGHKVLAVRQLRSGDLVVHMDSPAGKKEMETQKSWAEAIAPSAVIRKRTWPVIIHGVRVKDHQLEVWEKHAKSIMKENAKSVPNLRIRGMRWLRRTNKKEFAPLIIEVDSAEQANRLITEGVVIGYDLKLTERYDASCRITQCFKCQRYGHISSICSNTEKCGHCGGNHNTQECAGLSPAPRKRCAACHGGEHKSWLTECPERVKETVRAKRAKKELSRQFPISNIPPTLREVFGGIPAESTRPLGDTHATESWSTATTKKRKIQALGRPIGAVSKAKKTIDRNTIQSIFSFASQSQPQGTRNTSETPANTQPIENSQMDCDDALTIREG